MTTIMQPFQCDLPPQLQEANRTTHTGTTTRCKTHRRNNSRQKRPQPQPPHRRGTFHRRLQPLYTEKHKVSCSGFLPKHSPCNIHAAITLRFAASRSKPAPIYGRGNMTTTMQPFQCDLPPQLQETHRTTHTGTTTRCKPHMRNNSRQKRPQPQPPQRRGTFHRRLQPFYTEKHKVSCSGFLPNSPLAFVTASLPHHFPSSPLPFIITSLLHHFPSSPIPIVTTSLPHHFPSSPLPIVTTSHRHHFPSSPPPFVTTLCHSFLILCSVKSHTTLHQGQSFCSVKSHTTLHQGQSFCDILLYSVKSDTTLHQGQVSVAHHPSSFQVSEFYLSVARKYCFSTSFDQWLV